MKFTLNVQGKKRKLYIFIYKYVLYMCIYVYVCIYLYRCIFTYINIHLHALGVKTISFVFIHKIINVLSAEKKSDIFIGIVFKD